VKKIRTKTPYVATTKYVFRRAIWEDLLTSEYAEADREKALLFFKGCAFCGSSDAPRNDHLIPVLKGGEFIPKNVVPSCQRCDDSKGDKEFVDWMRNGKSKGSLRQRKNLTDADIEERIKRIKQWVGSYTGKTEASLFGDHSQEYRNLIKEMAELTGRAQELVRRIKASRHTE
jgi:5-methylcytosine-specific restriction endonuclease McrA